MYVALFLTPFIRIQYTCLKLAGSTKLMLPTWLCIAILTLSKYSASTSGFQAQYDESPISVNASQTKLLQFWLLLCGPELIESLDILAIFLFDLIGINGLFLLL